MDGREIIKLELESDQVHSLYIILTGSLDLSKLELESLKELLTNKEIPRIEELQTDQAIQEAINITQLLHDHTQAILEEVGETLSDFIEEQAEKPKIIPSPNFKG